MHRTFWLPAATLAILACDSPVGAGKHGWLAANLRGAVEAAYEGTGDFYVTHDWHLGDTTFQLRSEGEGSAAGQGFSIFGIGGMPRIGSHPLLRAAKVYGEGQGFTAVYAWRSSEWLEMYASVSGEFEITGASADRLEGRFRMNAVRYCRSRTGPTNELPQGSCNPTQLDLSAPSVEVTGSFVAVRVRQFEATQVQ
jgi:hypothetical protein